ncbi:MAG: hypothetical protein M3Q10_18685 [Chloroflexota bacterium]|nr:hypothetical protein [Chloroflexota bacterium]
MLAPVLVACVAEENSGPQFANNPRSTIEVALPSPPVLDPAADAALPGVASPEREPLDAAALLDTRGSPSRIFFRSGSNVWTVGADGEEPRRVFAAPPDAELIDDTASPSGDRVAVLVGGKGATVVVLDAGGRELARVEDVGRVLGSDGATPRLIDWSPQGDRLLVAFAPGGVVALPVDGGADPVVLFGAGEAVATGGAAWSPTGEAIAFLTPADGGESSGLYLARTAPEPASPTPLLETAGTDRLVENLAWSPDGRLVLFTLPAALGGANTGGDLWQIASDGSGRRVVAGAGAVGFPGAWVDAIAPAPDGDAVAYTVVVPEEDAVRFDSLWLKERSAAARALELAVPEGEGVTRLWWTSAGLLYQTVPAADFGGNVEGSSFALYQAGLPGENPVRLFAAGALAPGTPDVDATPQILGTPVPPAPPAGGTPPTS